MKKLISVLMALLFVMGISVSATAEELPKFSGLVTESTVDSVTVVNANGNALTFKLKDDATDYPDIGAFIEIAYSGDLSSVILVETITVLTPATQKTVSGTVTAIETGKITVKPGKGNSVVCNLISSTYVSGKAETYKEGDTVTVTYAECVQFMTTVNLATHIEVTRIKQEKKTEDEDTTNKQLTGVVTYWDGSKLSIRTSKGKTWTFKINSHTKYPSRKELDEGCTATVTYDGYASAHPYAKKINVTKTKSETERGKTYKKTGVCGQYAEDWCMVLKDGTYFEIAGAKHSGKSHRGEGYKVTITYYIKNGVNYATKLQWK